MRGDGANRRGKQEGGAMSGKGAMSRRIKRRWWQQGDATTSQGKQEGCASRGNMTTSWHLDRQCCDMR
jgi:hypothetical protein